MMLNWRLPQAISTAIVEKRFQFKKKTTVAFIKDRIAFNVQKLKEINRYN